jgi:dihydroorotase
MGKHIIANASVINENRIFTASVIVDGEFIIDIITGKQDLSDLQKNNPDFTLINTEGKYLIPGVIDDQVHFREPGLTVKGDIYTESKAAVAGGITSFMEMPNTNPQTLTQELLKTNPENVCGVKVFMGASTGNMLVDSEETLESIFSKSKMLIAVHCEDEKIIKENLKNFHEKFGDDIPITAHPQIRSREACYKSSSYAVELAKKHNTRLHVLHLSTKEEVDLFDNTIPLSEKNITAEVCVHHLWFTEADYQQKGTLIKWNPAIKESKDRDALLDAIITDKLDIIATDHAPHTSSEKQQIYMKAPSGGPLVQHSLNAMFELAGNKKITFTKVIEKMCHNPAILFRINKRGFIRKGYYADLTIIDPAISWIVNKENILYKCGWSPFENQTFNTKVTHTFINGELVYDNGIFNEEIKGKRLTFNR